MATNKPATKPATVPAVKKVPVARKPAIAKAIVKPEKKEKKAKVKVIRDSFTMPQADYDIIAEIKQKALKAGLHVKKSELLRAGLQVLAKLNAAQLKQTIVNLEKIKTGRPKNV